VKCKKCFEKVVIEKEISIAHFGDVRQLKISSKSVDMETNGKRRKLQRSLGFSPKIMKNCHFHHCQAFVAYGNVNRFFNFSKMLKSFGPI
jgi:hypothetical protein